MKMRLWIFSAILILLILSPALGQEFSQVQTQTPEQTQQLSNEPPMAVFYFMWLVSLAALWAILLFVYSNRKRKVLAGGPEGPAKEEPVFTAGQLGWVLSLTCVQILGLALALAFDMIFSAIVVVSVFGALLYTFRHAIPDILNSLKAHRTDKDGIKKHLVKKETTTFKDVGGHDEIIKEMKYVVYLYKNRAEAEEWDISPPSGVIMVGPPGNGKTLLARAIAGETEFNFLSYSGAEIGDKYVRSGSGELKAIVEGAEDGSIVFIDEIDALGRRRGQDSSGEFDHALTELLHLMDGFNKKKNIIFLAATNREDVLDEALLRPGRFDKKFVLGNFDAKGRHQILKIHTRKKRLANDVDLQKLARETTESSGAELAQIANEAAQLAHQRFIERKKEMNLIASVKEAVVGLFTEEKLIHQTDFYDAMEKIAGGLEMKITLSEEDKKTVAYHEMGHAIVTREKRVETLKKVTLTSRHRALGATLTFAEDRHLYSKEFIFARIAMLLGGRAAEEIFLGEDKKTSGGADDFEKAAELARRAVGELGMGRMGPTAFYKLDSAKPWLRPFSEHSLRKLDQEVERILAECLEEAKRIISQRKKVIAEVLVPKLLEKTSLDAEEIERALQENDTRE